MEHTRILNLDADETVSVTLGGQQFIIKQQRRAVIDRVIDITETIDQRIEGMRKAATLDKTEGETDEAYQVRLDAHDEAWVRDKMRITRENWETSIPAFCLIFGVEPGDEAYGATLAHLQEHLTFSKANRIYDAWFELNRVTDFFNWVGTPLVARNLYEQYLQKREEAMTRVVEQEVTALATSNSA